MKPEPASTSPTYIGTELVHFAHARNWKSYVAAQIAPWISGSVLEVGAGIGGNTATFQTSGVRRWVALEPDPTQAGAILDKRIRGELPPMIEIVCGAIDAIPPEDRFDTIIYVDVLEHIEDDAAELRRAAGLLAPNGSLIVLSPAHQFLFTPFDAAIGHYRRYNRDTLLAAGPPCCVLENVRMLDVAGLSLSLANRLFTRLTMPTPRQIQIWDRLFVPISRSLDRLTGYRFGKSILAVWRLEPGRRPDATGLRGDQREA